MAIKQCKTLAEYAVRKWLQEQNFDMDHFVLIMRGSEGILSDANGDTLKLIYDSAQKRVYAEE